MDTKGYVAVVMLILIFIGTSYVSKAQDQESNEIRIQDKEIIWLYKIRREQRIGQKIMGINLSSSSIYFRTDFFDDLRNFSTLTRVNTTFVFIGNERIYYQLTYRRPNIYVAIDTNIIVGKERIIIQWYSVKTEIEKPTTNNLSLEYIPLTMYVGKAIEKLGYNNFANYAAIMVRATVNSNIVESINLYDVLMNVDNYTNYIKRESELKKLGCPFSVPMYTWIEMSKAFSGGIGTTIVSINGMNTGSIRGGIKTLSCIISLIKIVDNIVKGIEIYTYYNEISSIYGIDHEKIFQEIFQDYVMNEVEYYINLIEELSVRRKLSNLRIEIKYGTTADSEYLNVVVTSDSLSNAKKEDIYDILVDIIRAPSLMLELCDINWEEALRKAYVIDTRSAVTIISNTTTTATIPDNVVILALSLSFIQAIVIISTILAVLKSGERR